MLLAHLEDRETETAADAALTDLETFYREAKARFDDEPDFADRARDYVVRLQSGETSSSTFRFTIPRRSTSG